MNSEESRKRPTPINDECDSQGTESGNRMELETIDAKKVKREASESSDPTAAASDNFGNNRSCDLDYTLELDMNSMRRDVTLETTNSDLNSSADSTTTIPFSEEMLENPEENNFQSLEIHTNIRATRSSSTVAREIEVITISDDTDSETMELNVSKVKRRLSFDDYHFMDSGMGRDNKAKRTIKMKEKRTMGSKNEAEWEKITEMTDKLEVKPSRQTANNANDTKKLLETISSGRKKSVPHSCNCDRCPSKLRLPDSRTKKADPAPSKHIGSVEVYPIEEDKFSDEAGGDSAGVASKSAGCRRLKSVSRYLKFIKPFEIPVVERASTWSLSEKIKKEANVEPTGCVYDRSALSDDDDDIDYSKYRRISGAKCSGSSGGGGKRQTKVDRKLKIQKPKKSHLMGESSQTTTGGKHLSTADRIEKEIKPSSRSFNWPAMSDDDDFEPSSILKMISSLQKSQPKQTEKANIEGKSSCELGDSGNSRTERDLKLEEVSESSEKSSFQQMKESGNKEVARMKTSNNRQVILRHFHL